MLPCGRTDGRTNKQTSENRATQSMDSVRLSFAMTIKIFQKNLPDEAAILILAGVAWVVLAWVLQIIIIVWWVFDIWHIDI